MKSRVTATVVNDPVELARCKRLAGKYHDVAAVDAGVVPHVVDLAKLRIPLIRPTVKYDDFWAMLLVLFGEMRRLFTDVSLPCDAKTPHPVPLGASSAGTPPSGR